MAPKTEHKTSGKLQEITGNGKSAEPKAEEKKPIKLPSLPLEKSSSAGLLEEKMVVIHGPPGVGKSTLASQWAGGDGLFFNAAGELGELEVYQVPIPDWDTFRLFSASVADDISTGKRSHPCVCIDTSDVLGKYCADKIRHKLGITHESDLDWGKGWSTLRDEWQVRLAKLAAVPGLGVVHVTHSTEMTIKTRSAEWNKSIFRGVKGVRETMLDMADIVLFVDFAEEDDTKRVIKTKPSRYWDAKERGQTPRLPSEIEWPLGENGWDILASWWEEGGK